MLDDAAMAHALAEALHAHPPDLSHLLTGLFSLLTGLGSAMTFFLVLLY
jgi:hypothetical protein